MGCFNAKPSFEVYIPVRARSELSSTQSRQSSITSTPEEDSQGQRVSLEPKESEKFPTLRVLPHPPAEEPLKHSKARPEERHRKSKRSVFANLQNAIIGSINFEEHSNFFDKAEFPQFLSPIYDTPAALFGQPHTPKFDMEFKESFEGAERKVEPSETSFELEGDLSVKDIELSSTPQENKSGPQGSSKGFTPPIFCKENLISNSFSDSTITFPELDLKKDQNFELIIHKPNDRGEHINKLMKEYPEYELIGQSGIFNKEQKSSVDIRNRATGKVITFFV